MVHRRCIYLDLLELILSGSGRGIELLGHHSPVLSDASLLSQRAASGVSSRFERISDRILQSLLPGFSHPEVLPKTLDILVLFLQLLAYPLDLQLRGHVLLLLLSYHRGCGLSHNRRLLHLIDAKSLFLGAFSCDGLQLRRLVGREFATGLVA